MASKTPQNYIHHCGLQRSCCAIRIEFHNLYSNCVRYTPFSVMQICLQIYIYILLGKMCHMTCHVIHRLWWLAIFGQLCHSWPYWRVWLFVETCQHFTLSKQPLLWTTVSLTERFRFPIKHRVCDGKVELTTHVGVMWPPGDDLTQVLLLAVVAASWGWRVGLPVEPGTEGSRRLVTVCTGQV